MPEKVSIFYFENILESIFQAFCAFLCLAGHRKLTEEFFLLHYSLNF